MSVSLEHSGETEQTTDEAGVLAEYGITRVPVDYFHYREFRYTNLKDAVAQAKRPSARGGGDEAVDGETPSH